jgi:hypothetical protein
LCSSDRRLGGDAGARRQQAGDWGRAGAGGRLGIEKLPVDQELVGAVQRRCGPATATEKPSSPYVVRVAETIGRQVLSARTVTIKLKA